jgi:hypothetical protein
MAEMIYAALDDDGTLLGTAADLEDAIQIARDEGSDAPIAVEKVREGQFAERNPGGPRVKQVEAAVKACGIPEIGRDEFFDMTPEEAFEELRYPFRNHPDRKRREFSYFPTMKWDRTAGTWERIAAYDNWKDASDTFLGGNFKMNKAPEDFDGVATAIGLSLLPANYLTDQEDDQGISFVDRIGEKMLNNGATEDVVQDLVFPRPSEKFVTMCQGASPACIETCLVVTGQNEADVFNAQRKIAFTNALLQKPHAFVRLLWEACHSLLTSSRKKKGVTPFARLNVFSDIPWEEIAPSLFEEKDGSYIEALNGGGFYDYTKVVGREPPPNYDLTFSYSGINEDRCRTELARGRRVAVVFLIEGVNSATARYDVDLRKTFSFGPGEEEYRVIDGDNYDMRSFDPGHGRGDPNDHPVVVGLRWKPPNVRGTQYRKSSVEALKRGFAIKNPAPTYKIVSPFFNVDGVLCAPTTGRSTAELVED